MPTLLPFLLSWAFLIPQIAGGVSIVNRASAAAVNEECFHKVFQTSEGSVIAFGEQKNFVRIPVAGTELTIPLHLQYAIKITSESVKQLMAMSMQTNTVTTFVNRPWLLQHQQQILQPQDPYGPLWYIFDSQSGGINYSPYTAAPPLKQKEMQQQAILYYHLTRQEDLVI